jgi:hypothetical protein
MMTPYRTQAAKRNLREGIKKMENVMSKAAQVRRDFRLGRPPKVVETMPLHRVVVWQRATDALANFRSRMTAAKLNPNHVTAAIVAIETADPDRPHPLLLEEEGKTPVQCRETAFETLGRDDVIALGMIFRQFDEQSKQQATFPYQFMGLNERGMTVLRKAALDQEIGTALVKTLN